MKLSKIDRCKEFIITSINCEDDVKSRLNDLGVVEGVKVTLVRYAPLLDPLEIKIRNCYLAIRKSLADKIEVKLC